MRRLLFLALLSMLCVAFGILANCSSPLDTTTGPNDDPPETEIIIDTLYLVDTVILIDSAGWIDTVVIVDTVIQIDSTQTVDTLTVYDTVTIIDTIEVTDTIILHDTTVVFDSTGSEYVCGRLNFWRKELVWTLHNDAGPTLLEFTADSKWDRPDRSLVVNIDGQEYIWQTSEATELVVEQELGENARIKISRTEPRCYGHSVDICLTISPLE